MNSYEERLKFFSSPREEADKFSPTRKIHIPARTFIELLLSEKDRKKLKSWMCKGQDFCLVPYSSGRAVVLLNTVQFDKWQKKKKAKR
jgi:hypothetical protein